LENFLRKIISFRLFVRRLLISAISAPQLASFFTKNAHYRDYRSHLTGFCSFYRDSSSPCNFTRGRIGDFNIIQRLIYFKMLVYTKSRVAVPSFLFTVGTVTGVIVTFLTFLRLTGFLLAFHISLKHGLHEGHALIAPRLLAGLLRLRGLTCCCLEGLTIAVIATAVQGVVGLEGTAMGFAMLTELLTATLLRDLTSQAPRCLALPGTLGFGLGCTALTFCLEFLALLLNHDSLYGLKVR
jgi:hypothetical protein